MTDEPLFPRFRDERAPEYWWITEFTIEQLECRLRFSINRLRKIRAELKREIEETKAKTREAAPQHKPLYRGMYLGLESAYATVDQSILTLEKKS